MGASKASRTMAKVAGPDPLADVRVLELTEEFRAVSCDLKKDEVACAVKLGNILREGRERLRGYYQLWIRGHLKIEPTSAQRYVRVAILAGQPGVSTDELTPFGLTKAYRLSRLTAEGRAAVFATPGADGLSGRQFREFTEPYTLTKRVVTGAMVAVGLRRTLASFEEKLDRVTLGPDSVLSDEVRDALRADLLRLSRKQRMLASRIRGKGDARQSV